MPSQAPNLSVLMRFANFLFTGALTAAGWAQGAASPKPYTDGSLQVTQSPAAPAREALESLKRLNAGLEYLATQASRGVVQILVTGYGPVEDSGRTDTSLIAPFIEEVLRLEPPLTVMEPEVETVIDAVANVLGEYQGMASLLKDVAHRMGEQFVRGGEFR